MATSKADVIVLGAGMIGVSAALHLQARGRDVALVERRAAAGEETSYGNAGLIERSNIFPYTFPRDLPTILRYALNRAPEAHYHLSALPTVLPWLARYFRYGSPQAVMRTVAGAKPLIERSLVEHEALMDAAGAKHLLRRMGWIKAFRTKQSMDKVLADVARLKPYGLTVDVLDARQLVEREPHLMGEFTGAVHLRDPGFVVDPGGLVKAYAALLTARGGRFVSGDARTLREIPEGWSVEADNGTIRARDAVVALGPWSDDVFKPLGYRIPLGIKRGYHRHYGARGNAVLNHPVLDVDGGYLLAPMARGIRLTTGAEFAKREAPPTPVQLTMAETTARSLFPLGEPIDATPWMGRRPCLPDMLPVIGQAGRHRRLWFDFGHQHHGFTLGPVSGRLLAEMITGETPFTDSAAYAAERFA
ncbi:MAG: FAD-binding oxidoreductase [Methylobacteriaceae bacterium]|nr:FAD-binding oxidoreductase [Methylobacteriaceae bacterium]